MAVVELVHSDSSPRLMRVTNPATLEVVGEFEAANAQTVDEAIAKARAAQPAWAALSFEARGAFMQRALDALLDRKEAFIDTIIRDTGRSRFETLFMEIFPACDSLNYWSQRAKKILADQNVSMHLLRMKKAKLTYRPLGVVGVISPWNGPFILSLNPTVQALMAGNTVVLKPSEITPFAGGLVQTLFELAGLPADVLQVVLGDGQTGAALVEGGIDKVAFTGSVATGRKVGEACGRNLIGCTLELGGKDAMIVCEDADLDRAAKGAAFGGFVNNGQFCCGTERVYVAASIADKFIDKLLAETKPLRVGGDGEFDIGPFIAENQIDIVERHVADAIEKGAKILTGGKRRQEAGKLFFEPTVVVDVTDDMLLMSEETFGPILPIVRVTSDAEALAHANRCRYGLSGNVWTKDAARAERLARRLEAGSVCVNDCAVTYGALELPFGGSKASGVGYANGEAGLRGYCQAVPIIVDRFGLKEEQVWFPYTAEKMNILQKSLHYLWGTKLGRWLMS